MNTTIYFAANILPNKTSSLAPSYAPSPKLSPTDRLTRWRGWGAELKMASVDIWLSTLYCEYILLLHYHPLRIWQLQWLALDYPLFIVTIWSGGGQCACERYEQKAAQPDTVEDYTCLRIIPRSYVCKPYFSTHYMCLFNIFTLSKQCKYTHYTHTHDLRIRTIFNIRMCVWMNNARKRLYVS